MSIYNVDSNLLYKAISFYKNLGYSLGTCPMLVDEDVINITLPSGREPMKHIDGKYFVGSAEQSYMQMLKDDVDMTVNKTLLITPCQRDEIVKDESHLNIFLKIELLSNTSVLSDVCMFYKYLGVDFEVIETEFGFDININGVEVGSFGCRTYNNRLFYYGTGLALPRYEYAILGEDL